MSDNKIVEMFDSIPKFDYFSKYSFSLQKVFNNCSLKNLIKELKSPKKKNENDNQNEEGKFYNDNINDFDNNFDLSNKKLENENIFDKKFDEKNMKKNHSMKQLYYGICNISTFFTKLLKTEKPGNYPRPSKTF